MKLKCGVKAASGESSHVDDVARYMIHSLDKFESLPITMNIGVGIDHTVQEYCEMVIKILGANVKIVADPSKPAGMQRKLGIVDLMPPPKRTPPATRR